MNRNRRFTSPAVFVSLSLMALLAMAGAAHAGSINVISNNAFYANKGGAAVPPAGPVFINGVQVNFVNFGAVDSSALVLAVPRPAPATYFFGWEGSKIDTDNYRDNPVSLPVLAADALTIRWLMSREAASSPGWGDLDGDELADDWEILWELDPKSASGENGRTGNPDGDVIPALTYIHPWTSGGSGYRSGLAFNNYREEAGLDGIYGFAGAADDPGTDPRSADSDDDGLPDGWEYYFWLRGQGLLPGGGGPHAWINIDPNDPDNASQDDDGDGLTNLEEYNLGTDPTHCDTDGDGMDDKYENDNGLDPLNPDDATENPDGDQMAFDGTRYHLDVYTKGAPTMEAGDTAFDPRTAWSDTVSGHPDTAGYNNIDEYLGGDRVGRIIWNADGLRTGSPPDDSTDPQSADTDEDSMPDGWELYVGLNPNDDSDRWGDPDGDGLENFREWANYRDANGNSSAISDWPNKLWPTDPGATWLRDRLFAWQNVWYDIGDDGIYDDGVDIQIWNGGFDIVNDPAAWQAMDGTEGWSDPKAPNVVGGSDFPIVYDSANDTAWADVDEDGVYTSGIDIPSTLKPPSDGDTGTDAQLYFYHNDYHPQDTDFDGMPDCTTTGGGEFGAKTVPTSVDSDGDWLPDGWEQYAHSDPLVNDKNDDPDGDGLPNCQEYWTGTVYEWMHIDVLWPDFPGAIITRRPMRWDLGSGGSGTQLRSDLNYILPPDFVSCPSFNVSVGQRADTAAGLAFYHTTRVDDPDSDYDGMDDYWEVYHGLNPTKGSRDLMADPIPFTGGDRLLGEGADVSPWDADSTTPQVYEIGLEGLPFTSVQELIVSMGAGEVTEHVGPFNFGLAMMDPDADGLANIEEYTFEGTTNGVGRALHHTDPTPYMRTAWHWDTNLYSFTLFNYTFDNYAGRYCCKFGWDSDGTSWPFRYEMVEGFDTDNDHFGDMAEINPSTPGSIGGSDPQLATDPIRNRAALFDRNNEDFLHQRDPVAAASANLLTRFTVEAWVRPVDLAAGVDQVVVDKTHVYNDVVWGSNAVLRVPRSNFRIGIDVARRPYVMFHNAMGTPFAAFASNALPLSDDVWTHLAGAFDGTNLVLYVNGQVGGRLGNVTAIPVNGYDIDDVNFARLGSTCIGARDGIEDAVAGLTADALPFFYSVLYWALGFEFNYGMTEFYSGYVDEVRVWHGARMQSAIQAAMRTKLAGTESDDHASLEHYYPFDDVPDVDVNWAGGTSEDVVPANLEARQGSLLPLHPTIFAWIVMPQRSTVYTGSPAAPYNYLVYANDVASHRAIVPPTDDLLFGDSTNGLPAGYNNTANPYERRANLVRYTVDSPLIDLLFLNGARADGDVFTNATWMTGEPLLDPDATDSDGDGLPDDWEIAHGLDPHDASGDNGADGDMDGDGLTNLSEYLAGLNPNSPDSDGNGTSDYDEDSDDDRLTNGAEQDIYKTDPGDPDTDDDNVSDGDEVDPLIVKDDCRTITSPTYSRSPLVQRSIEINGTPISVPESEGGASRFNLSDWTIEAWVNPASDTETGNLIVRRTSTGRTNFALRLDSNFPHVEFTTAGGTRYRAGSNTNIPPNEWSYVAGVFSSSNQTLQLYVNGVMTQAQVSLDVPARGQQGVTELGEGVSGYLDEVRIWNVARSTNEIATWTNRHLFSTFGIDESSVIPQVDFVFLIDVSGSMGAHITKVKATLTDFVMQMEALGLDAQLAGVRFSDTLEGGGGESDTPPSGAGFFSAASTFLTSWLDPLELEFGGDGPEDDLGGLMFALNPANFSPTYRPGAKKVYLLLTDASLKDTEDGDTGAELSLEAVITDLIAAGVTVHGVHDLGDDDVAEIVTRTGGLAFDIDSSSYSNIFDTLASVIAAEVIRAGASNTLAAYYTFDDSENTTHLNPLTGVITGYGAEDFSRSLQWEFALRNVTFTDATAAPIEGTLDLDGNGIADWWEDLYFGGTSVATNDNDNDGLINLWEYRSDTNPKDSDTDNDGTPDPLEVFCTNLVSNLGLQLAARDPDGDYDGDGLSNAIEIKLGTDPALFDTDGNGFSDGDEDFDGDGLSNAFEMNNSMSNPFWEDTDDDGITDKNEVDQCLDPNDSISPYVMRYIRNNGDGWISVTNGPHLQLTNWTVEATVRLADSPLADVILVRRESGTNGLVTFELGVSASRFPYVRFHHGTGVEYRVDGYEQLPIGEWVTLGGKFGTDERGVPFRQLALFYGNHKIVQDCTDILPVAHPSPNPLILGLNLDGDIDEVRIWNRSRTDLEIQNLKNKTLLFGADVAKMGSLQAQGGSMRRQVSSDIELADWTIEAWFKTAGSGVILRRSAGTSCDGEEIHNYQLRVDDDGYLQGSYDVLADVWFTSGTNSTHGERYGTVRLTASGTAVTDNQWHHAALVHGPAGAALYLDGSLEDFQPQFPATTGGADWHMCADEGDPGGFHSSAISVATLPGPLEVGPGFGGLVDEVRIYDAERLGMTIRAERDKKVSGGIAGLRSYFDFDDIETGARTLTDKATVTTNTADLRGAATITTEQGDNAPVTFKPLDILAAKLAAYFPMDDGRNVNSNGYQGVEDLLRPVSYLNLANYAYAGTLLPSTNEIDFVPRDNPFAWTTGATNYPNPFPIPTDSPWRLDSDGDGMPDMFEVYYRFDPNRADIPDAPDSMSYGDSDGDGLDNLQEYLAGTNPRDFDSDDDGIGDFDDRAGPGDRTWGELFNDGDGMADIWELRYPQILSPLLYDADLDPDEDGWSNYGEFMNRTTDTNGVSRGSTDPSNPADYPQPRVTFAFKSPTPFGGAPILLQVYHEARMDGYPDATRSFEPTNALSPLTYSTAAFNSGHLREGDAWFFAFVDSDGDGTWTPGEPAGVAQGQPIRIGWGDVPEVVIGLTDSLPGQRRFAWSAVQENSSYTVGVRNLSMTGWPFLNNLSNRVVHGPRTYFHEGDYRYAGYNAGLAYAGYQWIMWVSNGALSASGTFNAEYPASLTTPVLPASPGEIVFARNEFAWQMDTNSTRFRIQISTNSSFSTLVHQITDFAPYRDADTFYRYHLPVYAGDGRFTNGTYYWRVMSWNGRTSSAYSASRSFTVNLQESPLGAYTIAGNTYYFGKATNYSVVVQAYRSSGLSGVPDAQVTLTNKGAFKLMGLRAGTYYVLAFNDQNGNKKLDRFESFGFVKDTPFTTDYTMRSMQVPGNVINAQVVIRDRDTDNDGMPDAWEYQYFGNLTTAGPGTDYDGDGLTDLREYEISLADTSPLLVDTDGDGLTDYNEVFFDGDGDYNPYNPTSNPTGTDTDAHLWDSDGNGISDGEDDWDGDGISNVREFDFGTHPLVYESMFPFAVAPGLTADVVSYNLNAAVTTRSVTFTAYPKYTTNLLPPQVWSGVPGANKSALRDVWRSRAFWTFTNSHPDGVNGTYRIDWGAQ